MYVLEESSQLWKILCHGLLQSWLIPSPVCWEEEAWCAINSDPLMRSPVTQTHHWRPLFLNAARIINEHPTFSLKNLQKSLSVSVLLPSYIIQIVTYIVLKEKYTCQRTLFHLLMFEQTIRNMKVGQR